MAHDASSDIPARIEAALERALPAAATEPARLHEAMRYAVLGGGKRIRPRLVHATGQTLGVAAEQLDAPATAVELIHAYSLVHDDLPAMDDDALRRGAPTVHIAYDEATAILAGDALQSLAFEILAADTSVAERPAIGAARTHTLALACGSRGMVGGQVLDMASEGQTIDQATLERLHRHKTGALLRACVRLAADTQPSLASDRREALDHFAEHIGLAFQVRDDVLDIESDTQTLGKTQGADIAHAKATYPALLGLDAARDYANRLYEQALAALAPFGDDADPLRAIAAEIVKRDH
ncbi:farnesyl diphosphate synthase [Salinisphaera sp.]|uniref:farnesyl diphosphate synthase n=1 Tax=Salinisphaera sp. TaxID=1914330 RepID=UPI000C39B9A9|nr:farnesyl diphosphate synthase [Salinisphaera sp.]MBS61708.1 geranyl transferase [Salinisphaera sp.]